MDDTTLFLACEGKTAKNGGLNLPEFRKQLMARYPTHSAQIKTMNRSDLNELCRQLLTIPSQPESTPITEPHPITEPDPIIEPLPSVGATSMCLRPSTMHPSERPRLQIHIPRSNRYQTYIKVPQ
jgi:hypothetical protein